MPGQVALDDLPGRVLPTGIVTRSSISAARPGPARRKRHTRESRDSQEELGDEALRTRRPLDPAWFLRRPAKPHPRWSCAACCCVYRPTPWCRNCSAPRTGTSTARGRCTADDVTIPPCADPCPSMPRRLEPGAGAVAGRFEAGVLVGGLGRQRFEDVVGVRVRLRAGRLRSATSARTAQVAGVSPNGRSDSEGDARRSA